VNTATVADVRALFAEQEYSRFPVYKESLDHISGFIFVKDLVTLSTADDGRPITGLLRPAVVVPETKRVPELLKQFQRQQTQCAIVVDEYGGTAGLVTIEDVIEQIVGEIDDEFDVEDDHNIRPEDARHFTVRGVTRMEEFNEYFGTGFAEEGFDTIAGLVMKQLGRMPRRGEALTIDGFEFRVARADRRRVDSLRITAPRDIVPPEERST